MKLPVLASARQTYRLLWRYRELHAKAVGLPLAFLVSAEFVFHVAWTQWAPDGPSQMAFRQTCAGGAVLWLCGLFLLCSFSVSWRRHVMLGEEFDFFYTDRPMIQYIIKIFILALISMGIFWL